MQTDSSKFFRTVSGRSLYALIIGIMVFISIHTYSCIYFGFRVKLKNNYYIYYNGDYLGIEDRYHKVLANGMDLSLNDKINFDATSIFGFRNISYGTTLADSHNEEKEYFVIDLKLNKLYENSSIDGILRDSNIEPEKFETLYPVSFYFHYYRLVGGLFQ